MLAPALRRDPGRALWLRLLLLRRGVAPAREEYLGYFWPELQQEVRRYARLGGPPEELQAEAALALWEAAFQYDPRRHRTAVPDFVKNQVHRRVRTAYRQAMGFDRQKVVPLASAEGVPAAAAPLAAVEARLDLDRAQAHLPPREQALLRHYLQLAAGAGAGPDQAAHLLAARHGSTPAAWKKRLQRARHKLQRLLADEQRGEP